MPFAAIQVERLFLEVFPSTNTVHGTTLSSPAEVPVQGVASAPQNDDSSDHAPETESLKLQMQHLRVKAEKNEVKVTGAESLVVCAKKALTRSSHNIMMFSTKFRCVVFFASLKCLKRFGLKTCSRHDPLVPFFVYDQIAQIEEMLPEDSEESGDSKAGKR